jgi:hypothetical protein
MDAIISHAKVSRVKTVEEKEKKGDHRMNRRT